MSPGSPGVPEACRGRAARSRAARRARWSAAAARAVVPHLGTARFPNTMPSAMIQSRARAGASDGAQAMTAARRSDALPAAPHDLCATTALWKSQGSRRWTSTRGRTSVDKSGEEGGRESPGDAGEDPQPLAVGHARGGEPPALDRERRARSTEQAPMAKDGPAGQSEPSTATTAAKGSAGPTRPTATSRTPHAASLQSAATVCREGAVLLPRASAQASRLVKDAMLTTSAASTAQAPPPEKESQFADGTALAAVTVVQTPSQLGGGHAQRRDAGPGRRAEGLDPGTGARDRAEAEHGRERGPPFGQNGLRPLSDEVGDGSPQRERKQAEPMQRHGSRRCVDQAPVQLSEAGHVGPARAARDGSAAGPAGRDGYPRARCEHDAASTQAGAHTRDRVLRRHRRVRDPGAGRRGPHPE